MSSSPGVFRKRDFAVILLVLVSVYLTLFEAPTLKYTLEPAWFVDNRSQEARNPMQNLTQFRKPELDYGRLQPIITDLDGDLSKEVIIINKDYYLQVRYILRQSIQSFPHNSFTDIQCRYSI